MDNIAIVSYVAVFSETQPELRFNRYRMTMKQKTNIVIDKLIF